jgi:uncharacterized protein YdcH (DUF465 family)
MTAESQELAELLRSDAEFHRLFDTHHDLETRLHELSRKQYLTGSEEVEETTLKKRKLRVKDQMEAILRQHRYPGLSPAPPG